MNGVSRLLIFDQISGVREGHLLPRTVGPRITDENIRVDGLVLQQFRNISCVEFPESNSRKRRETLASLCEVCLKRENSHLLDLGMNTSFFGNVQRYFENNCVSFSSFAIISRTYIPWTTSACIILFFFIFDAIYIGFRGSSRWEPRKPAKRDDRLEHEMLAAEAAERAAVLRT